MSPVEVLGAIAAILTAVAAVGASWGFGKAILASINSRTERIAVLEAKWEAGIKAQDELQNKVAELELDRVRMATCIENLQRQIERLEDQLQARTRKLEETERLLAEAHNHIDRLTENSTAAQAERDEARRQVDHLQEQLAACQARLAECQARKEPTP